MPFKFEGYEEPKRSGFVFEGYEQDKPASVKGAASSFGSGFTGGAGGLVPDVIEMTKPIQNFLPVAKSANQLAELAGLKTTPELTESVSQKLGSEGPQNALERILKQSGEFSGQEGLIGTAVGGPVGAGLGAAHGAASGALFGGLKELGVSDPWALGLTTLATLSPIAARKFISNVGNKLPKGASVTEIANEVKKISPEPAVQRAPSKPLPGRVSKEGKDVGIRPRAAKEINPLIEEVGRSVSPDKFKNTSEGGRALLEEIRNQDKAAYENVSKSYQESRKANKGIEEIHPELVDWMENKISELKEIPEPSNIEKDLLRSLEGLSDRLSVKDSTGNISGYKPINNQVLIDQVQSLRRKNIDYDFSHGDAKNIWRPYIEQVQSSARQAASKNPEALKLFDKARSEYASWAQKFDNPYIRPFRDKSNRDFSKMYRSSQDIDEARALGEILNQTSSGKEINKKLLRDLTETRLSPFVEDLSKFDARKFENTMREIGDVVPEESLASVREQIAQYSKRPGFVANQIRPGERFKLNEIGPLIKSLIKFSYNPTGAAIEVLGKIQKPGNLEKLQRIANKMPKTEQSAAKTEELFKKISKELD